MIGYLGPEGSFTHQAIFVFSTLQMNEKISIKPFNSISSAIEAVSSGKIDSCIVPVENSIGGSVTETLDSLIKTSQKVTINHEIIMSIEHCLITKAKDLNKIKKISAHPQALLQCDNFIKRMMPDVELDPLHSNSLAIKNIKNSTDETLAAIGPELASEIYGVPILKKGINDEEDNYTRFALISTSTNEPTEHCKTTLAFGVPHDKPGTLVEVLKAFANQKVNLTRIESRPSKKSLGEYVFFIDLEAHREDERYKKALSEIASYLSFYRWLGSYPIWKKK